MQSRLQELIRNINCRSSSLHCDYTLIGEELYAASAYLSREPMLLGSLKGQDYGKVMIFGAIVIGVILELIGITWLTTFFQRVK